ncbi:MAG: hypothetical protein EOO08_12145 [Chitinophagaceae bacterium]|nr:MAG: hypothetical protein EOO08_12145 [Chitinophagaceae bacterium]
MNKRNIIEETTDSSWSAHQKLLKNFTFNNNLPRFYKSIRVRRVVSARKSEGVVLPEHNQETVSKTGIVFYPEALEYLFFLEGIPKKLFLFLTFYYASPKTNLFRYNAHTVTDFNAFCSDMNSNIPSPHTTKQALETLKGRNILLNKQKGLYMINPLIAASPLLRRDLIGEYSNLLLKKKRDIINDFYPINGTNKSNDIEL